MLGGLAAPEGNSHPVDDMFPSLHAGTCGTRDFFLVPSANVFESEYD